MKYIQHDTSAMEDEKLSEVFIRFGYEGIGLFWAILEKIGKQEKPVKTMVLKKQLHVGKKLEKVWVFLEELELISSNNGETFNKQLLNYAGKYQVEKEKNRERIAEWRKNQVLSENVTCNEPIRNTPKVNRSKENRNHTLITPSAEKKTGVHVEIDPVKIEQLAKFHDFEKWIVDNAPQVAKMKEPFTFEQWQKATLEFGKLGPTLKNMHNYKPLLTKNVSAYLTLCNWARRDLAKQTA